MSYIIGIIYWLSLAVILCISSGSGPAWGQEWASALYLQRLVTAQAVLTPDGTAFAAMHTEIAGQNPVLVALDSQGKLITSRALGGEREQNLVLDFFASSRPLLSGVRDAGWGSGYDLVWAQLEPDLDQAYAKAWQVAGDQSGFCRPTTDGGLFCLGSTPPLGVSGSASDLLVLKVNAAGSVSWNLTLDQNIYDQPCDWAQSGNGYYVLGSHRYTSDGASDLLVFKLDNNGSLVWTRSLVGSGDKTPVALQTLVDGGVVLLAQQKDTTSDTRPDWLVVRLASGGSLEWARLLDSGRADIPSSLVLSQAGNPVAAGWFTNPASGRQDLAVIEMNLNGTIARQKVFTGLGDSTAKVYLHGEGYLLGGNTSAPNGGNSGNDLLMVGLNGDLSPAWQRAMGSLGDDQGWVADPKGQEASLGFFLTSELSGLPELGLVNLPAGGDYSGCSLVRDMVLGTSSGGFSAQWTQLESRAAAPLVDRQGRLRDFDLSPRDVTVSTVAPCP